MPSDDSETRRPESRGGLIVLWIAIMLVVPIFVDGAETLSAMHHRRASVESHASDMRTAVATEDLADLTVFQVTLAGLALLGVGGTVHFARRAFEEAQRSADVAHDLLSHERQSTQHQLRAYVFVTVTRLKDNDSASDMQIWVRLNYANSGKTPAKNVRIQARAIQLHRGTDIDLSDAGPVQPIGPLGPGDERMMDIDIEVQTGPSSDEQWEIHLFGRIDYDDEFADGRWTTFHAWLDRTLKGKTLRTHQTGNDYR
jgi:hypothetical protein